MAGEGSYLRSAYYQKSLHIAKRYSFLHKLSMMGENTTNKKMQHVIHHIYIGLTCFICHCYILHFTIK